MSHDSTSRTLGMALAVTIISSILVSTAVVTLKPLQQKNSALDKKRNILLSIGISASGNEVEKEFSKIKPVVIDLASGKKTEADPEKFDLGKLLKSRETSILLEKKDDVAGIRILPKQQLVYLAEEEGKLKYVILPVYGKGLWSTMYGFLAVENDMTTIKGLTFYEHGETPGLGGEIENPKWQAIWPGKKVYGNENEVKIEVIKGNVTEKTAEKEHKIDGLAGATLTSRGVSVLIQFWTSEKGYQKLFENLKKGEFK
jgi:Na+-transporting NADH:ubiquinone oxidoreductase subunit C